MERNFTILVLKLAENYRDSGFSSKNYFDLIKAVAICCLILRNFNNDVVVKRNLFLRRHPIYLILLSMFGMAYVLNFLPAKCYIFSSWKRCSLEKGKIRFKICDF